MDSVVGILATLRAVLCDDQPTSASPTNGLCNTLGVGLFHLGLYYPIATSPGGQIASPPTERLSESPYSRVTAILLESALPFTVLGILSSVVAFVDTSGANHARLFSSRVWTVATVSGSCSLRLCILNSRTLLVITYRVITGISFTSNSPAQADEGAISHSIHFTHSAPVSRSRSGMTFRDLA
ncbi:hypothetical protein BKA70DRAFT_1262854 [Coprinopsis sp. MPI-PUGE-AT-0042]|nr:hypothetical protein BKA70DRAFT_1262854 [Coprinopsis sp. MPI-PUGE-AT-0042]